MPAFVLVGVMKSGTTDLHFRTNNATWAYGGDRKESHWFETACKGRIGDRLSDMQVQLDDAGAPQCPPSQPPKTGTRKHARRLPVNPEFPDLRSDVYLDGCTAWHFQHFFKGGAYQCSVEPPFTPSDEAVPPMQLWPSPAARVRPNGAASGPPPDGMWFDGGGRPDLAGWRIAHDASPKLLPMVDGPASAVATSPLTRFVMQFRHPVERAWSHFFHVRFGNATADELTPDAFHRSAMDEVSNFQRWGGDVHAAVAAATDALGALSAQARAAAVHVLAEQLTDGSAGACLQAGGRGVVVPLVRDCVHAVDTVLGAAAHWVQEAGLGVQDKGYAGGVKSHTSEPVAPSSVPAAAARRMQADVQRLLRRPPAQAALRSYRSALGEVLAVWRRVMLSTYEGYDFDNFKRGGTILARGLYAAQTLRLFSLVPPADVFLSQAEEYYRDPKPVLAALQSWLCVPLQRPPCVRGHPFRGGGKGGQDVVARPSAPKYRMLPESDAALSGAIAPHMAQHARLLELLSGGADARLAAGCLLALRAACKGDAAAKHSCAAAAPVMDTSQCSSLGVGPLASVALLQTAASSSRAVPDSVLGRLQHRWNKHTWNSSLLQPGSIVGAKSGEGYMALLGLHRGGAEQPRGGAAYSDGEVQEATSWEGC